MTIHDFTLPNQSKEIKIEDDEVLLFIKVTGRGDGIQENDFIILFRKSRKTCYRVWDIEYSGIKFTALLTFEYFLN